MTDFVRAESGIRQLHARCIDAVWRKDAKAFADCFAEDGEWKIAGLHMHGRAEIEAAIGKFLGLSERVFIQNGDTILEVDGATAIGRTYVLEHSKRADGQGFTTIGIYYERFAEEEGAWKFRWRHWSLQYRGPADLSERFYDSHDYGPPPGMPGQDEPTTIKRPE